MCAFFYFSQAMRFLNHVCILVNINITDDEVAKLDKDALIAYHKLNADVIGDMMNRGAYCNTIGFRMYYLSFPIIAWIGGGYFMIATTCVLIFVLRTMDFNIKTDVTRRNGNQSSPDIIEMASDMSM